MAYCRGGSDSDLYIYKTLDGNYAFLISNKNTLGKEGKSFTINDLPSAIRRVKRLKAQGFKVPDYTLERMEKELKKNGR